MFRFRFKRRYLKFLLAFLIVVMIFVLTDYWHQAPKNLPAPTLEEIIFETNTNNDDIPVIDNPAFESVGMADQYLQNEGKGIVVLGKGEVRFYPYQILVWHFGVNDVLSGTPILVSYNPFCGSAIVFSRKISEETILQFKNSGKIYNNILLFSDGVENETLWNSLNGQALLGPGSGQSLSFLSSQIMTWKNFKENYPRGSVLSRETGFSRDYSKNPYSDYTNNNEIWFPLNKYDSSLPAKTFVYGLSVNNDRKAYPEDNLKSTKIIEEKLGEQNIRLVWDEKTETPHGYVLEDDGSLGEELILRPMYWLCWAADLPLAPPY